MRGIHPQTGDIKFNVMKYILKSILRSFIRRPGINCINLLGLALSLSLVIILSAYCYSELTTDNFHKNADRVYLYGDLGAGMYTPAILKEHISRNIPQVESVVRIGTPWEVPVFQVKDKEPISSDLIFADTDFFKLFTYKAVQGSLAFALNDPMSVVITQSLSDKLFGRERALGKTIKLNNNEELVVKAVIEELRTNSSLSFSAVTSIATEKIIQPDKSAYTDWFNNNFQTFLLLKKGADTGLTAKSILLLFPGEHRKFHAGAKLIPFKTLYFSRFSLYDSNYLHCGDMKKVILLVMVAALVLLIALVNFINISSSQWLERTVQTGVMKIIGAGRSRIFRNILAEAFMLFLAAFSISVVITIAINPFIKTYTGILFNPKIIYSPAFLLFSTGGTFILSMLLSLIPALRISSSRAVDNLKKTISPHARGSLFRGILVTTQFIIAIVLIAFTTLVQKQVSFGSNLGINQDNIIGIKLTPQLYNKKDVLKKTLQEYPAVSNISFTQYYPGKTISNWGRELNLNGEKKIINFDIFSADPGIFEIMGMKLIRGRFYSEDFSTDSGKMVVNEAFVREYKLGNPIGFKLPGGNSNTEIIGVVKDFHYKPFSQPIAPLVIMNNNYASYCLVKLQATDFNSLHRILENIKTEMVKISPSFPVDISFFDQAVERMYQSELQFRQTFSLFAVCAIVICCLGILAMSLLSCQKRIKEIGIRKVNGAGVWQLMVMLNKEFLKWVAVAFLIAAPIAYYVMYKWLEGFAYKTELSWWIFTLAGAMALGVALLTASWESWKAATKNPVKALKYE